MKETLRREINIHRKVLLVDDEPINRQILKVILSNEYEVIQAENGEEALQKIAENQNTISLILLDLLMPKMDGYQLLQKIQETEEYRKIPVIVVTVDKEAEVKCLSLGATDFMPKPYEDPKVIVARCKKAIQLAEDRILINENERDSLTGLYTRLFFLQYARLHDRFCHSILMDAVVINVNRFRLVNNLYGSAYGDRILRTIADVIRKYLENTDGIACRCDSDTFYIYCPHILDHGAFASEFISRFEKIIDNSRITLRLGIYDSVDRSLSIEQRLDMAKNACLRLKNTYTSGYSLYDSQLHEKELFNEKLILEMDRALAEKHFRVYFQPKYSITGDTPKMVSAEALIRWIHPEFGIISPGIFISLFEENGLLQKLDHYVWNETAAQIRDWKDRLGKYVPVSVNVSRTDIYDTNLTGRIESIIRDHGLAPADMYLEITESAYTDNTKQIVETVDKLRQLEFKIEMDDFGSGYSSLSMLSNLPIDVLKLDMQFIKNITRSRKDYNLLLIMMQIAEFLKVPTVAEGVETKEQYDMLKKAGCDIIQGYYFSKPLPAEEFEKLLIKES